MSNRIRNNSIYLLILTFSNYFSGLLAFPYLSRVLTIQNFGLIGFAMSCTLVFQSIVEYGFAISGTAKISKSRNNTDAVSLIVTDIMHSKGWLIAIALIAFLASSLFMKIIRDNLAFMSLFFCSGMIAALIPDFYFRGTENMRTIALRALAARLLSVVVIIVLVRGDQDRLAVPVAFLLGNLASVVWALASMRKLGFKFSKFSRLRTLDNIKEGFLFFLSRISTTVNQAAGAFSISLIFSGASKELGLYAAAWRLASAGEMLLIPVSDSLYPHMIKERDYKLFWKIYVSGIAIWFICCLGVFVLANLLCLLILGPNYPEAGNILRILLFGTFMAFSSNMFGYNALSPIGLVWHANISLILSVILNIILLSALVLSHEATLRTICVVVASTNLFLFIYRASVMFIHRDRLRALPLRDADGS